MSQKIPSQKGPVALLTGTALMLLLSGCVGDMPHRGAWVGAPKNKRTLAAFSVPDVYYYYPDYGVYYNTTQRCYVYPERGIWLSATVPTNIATKDLQGARAVKMTFHDSPALHHASMTQLYPRKATAVVRARRPTETHPASKRLSRAAK